MPPQYIALLLLLTTVVVGGVVAATFAWDLVRRPSGVTSLAGVPSVLLASTVVGIGWGTRFPLGTEGMARAAEIAVLMALGACAGLLLGGAAITLARALRPGEPTEARTLWPVVTGLVGCLVISAPFAEASLLLTPPVTVLCGFAMIRWMRGGRRFEDATGPLLSMWAVGTGLFGAALFVGRVSGELQDGSLRVWADFLGPLGRELGVVVGVTTVGVLAVVGRFRRWGAGLLVAVLTTGMAAIPMALFARPPPVFEEPLPRWVDLLGQPGAPLPFTWEHHWTEELPTGGWMGGGMTGFAAGTSTPAVPIGRTSFLVDDGRRFLGQAGSSSTYTLDPVMEGVRRWGSNLVVVRWTSLGLEVDGAGPFALGPELHRELRRVPIGKGVDVERSPWLTVQDYVSICASLGPPDDCALVGTLSLPYIPEVDGRFSARAGP